VKIMRQKLVLAGALGVGSIGLFGAAALAAFGLDASASTLSTFAPAASALMGGDRTGDKLKDLLDALVQKGVITQQQEDAMAVQAGAAMEPHRASLPKGAHVRVNLPGSGHARGKHIRKRRGRKP